MNCKQVLDFHSTNIQVFAKLLFFLCILRLYTPGWPQTHGDTPTLASCIWDSGPAPPCLAQMFTEFSTLFYAPGIWDIMPNIISHINGKCILMQRLS